MPRNPISATKAKNSKATFKNLVLSLRPYRYAIFFAIVLAAISAFLSVLSPKLLGEITTSATNSLLETGAINWKPIIRLADLLLVLYLISSILNYFQSILITVATAKYTEKLRTEILEKISRLPIAYFDKNQYGDTLSRMSNDIDVIASSLSSSLTESIASLTTVVGILIMMLSISFSLSAIALITVPLSLLLAGKVAKKAQKYFAAERKTLGKLNSIIEEDYSGQLIIKSNSHVETSVKAFTKVNQTFYEQSWKSQFFSRLAFPITNIITNFGYIAVCILGGLYVISGKISVGNIQAFIQYVSQFNRPLTSVAEIIPAIQQTLAAAERIFEFLSEPEEQKDPEIPQKVPKVQGAVEFHNVNFSYDGKKSVIKNLSAKIAPGQQVAIVGPTGAGKTTIINLLMRFYDPTSGYISIDGVPTKEMRREDVRNLFGMVLQDTWLFSGTIEENLRYGNPHASLKEIKAATSLSNIDHFIESLPKSYSTPISEDSDNISAGEKQLLTIARAMIANPPMMILDEATSNVDTRTERLIQAAFDKLTKNRTSFVIAHRLSTIRNSDLILVMKDGNIVEQGTHDELLAKNGFYAELYNSQFAEN
ncbi:ABC transporter ATP-binding protein [Candidatus Saccharibacteria bacterium]|nr:ABC transporter ATP-binding protein [Candidatus Saccharibacteria bacterium]